MGIEFTADYKPALRAGLCISPFDTSSRSSKYLVAVEDRRFQVSEEFVAIAELMDGQASVRTIADRLGQRVGRVVSPDEVIAVLRDFFDRHRLLAEYDGKPEKPTRTVLLIKVPIAPQKALRPITSVLQVLFRLPVAVPVVAIVVAAHLLAYLGKGMPAFDPRSISGVQMFAIYLAMTLGSMFHELGHSSACTRFGATHGTIGWGIYIMYSVFYADVTDAWKLRRNERVVIDLGGIYFQSILVAVAAYLYVVTSNPIFAYFVYVTDMGMVANLNPLLRMDGYWLFSDALGLPNLRAQTRDAVRYTVRRLFGRSRSDPKPAALDTPLPVRVFFWAYLVVSNLFFGWFIIGFVTRVIPTYVPQWPSIMYGNLLQLVASFRPLDIPGVLNAVTGFVLNALFMVTIVVLLFSTSKMAFSAVASAARRFSGRKDTKDTRRDPR